MDKYGETDYPNVSELRGPPILRAKQYIKLMEKCVPYDQPPPLPTECNSVEGGEQEEEFIPKARKPLKAARKAYALRRGKNVSELRGAPILRAKHYVKINKLMKEKLCVAYDHQPLLETEFNSVEGGDQQQEKEEGFVPKIRNLRPRIKPDLKAAKKSYACKNVKKDRALGNLSLVEPSPDQSPALLLPFQIDSDHTDEEEEPITRKTRLLKDIYDSTKCGSYNYPQRDD